MSEALCNAMYETGVIRVSYDEWTILTSSSSQRRPQMDPAQAPKHKCVQGT